MSIAAPFVCKKEVILPDWIDYNGHMNVSYYVLVFDHATDEFIDLMGLTAEFRAAGNVSAFTAEMHVNYIREVKQGDEVFVTTQLLGYDAKRFHYFHRMYHAEQGYLAATSELLCLYVDMAEYEASSANTAPDHGSGWPKSSKVTPCCPYLRKSAV